MGKYPITGFAPLTELGIGIESLSSDRERYGRHLSKLFEMTWTVARSYYYLPAILVKRRLPGGSCE